VGYALVVWAMTQASIGAVAALRECSVVFAALIGVAFLGEPFRRARRAPRCSFLPALWRSSWRDVRSVRSQYRRDGIGDAIEREVLDFGPGRHARQSTDLLDAPEFFAERRAKLAGRFAESQSGAREQRLVRRRLEQPADALPAWTTGGALGP